MICKKDVVLWFKELESYKRIDTMCTLLNMCLPFELRFLGTCLEELGRRDSQELRGIELRVNNPGDLASDMVSCQKGEPTDKKIRRKMALYLALIRACNRTCVTEIFRTLDGWGDRDFQTMTDYDALQELLLVYTMAAHHPVFSFDQHMKCNEIFEKILQNKLCTQYECQAQQQEQQLQQQQQQQQQQTLHMHEQNAIGVNMNLDMLQQQQQQQQQTGAAVFPHLVAPIQVLPQGSMPLNFPHLTKLLPSADGSMQHQITLDGIPHMISSNISIPTDTNAVLAHANAAWSLRPYPPPPPLTQSIASGGSSSTTTTISTSMEQPPQTISPMLSQQSSPSSSRAASPNRIQQQQQQPSSLTQNTTQQQQQQQQQSQTQPPQLRNISQRLQNVAGGGGGGSLKHVRRPSTERTPPPMVHAQMELILPPNLKHMDDVAMSSEGNSGNQLQTLIRNGFNRNAHHPRMKGNQYMSQSMHHQQQQQQQQQQQAVINQQNFQIGGFQTLNYAMQNLSMDVGGGTQTHVIIDGSGGGGGGMMPTMNSNRSAGSDSGSSLGSSGDLSPPETPTLIQQQQQQQQSLPPQKHQFGKNMNLARINGGRLNEKVNNVASNNNNNNNNNSNNNNNNNNNSGPSNQGATIIYAASAPQLYATGNDIILAPPTVSSPVATVASSGSNVNSVSNNNAATVLMPPYNTNYPYHALANSTALRPPLMGQPSLGVPPPPNSFRLPSGFQLPPPPPQPPNGELIYPAYHPAGGITFLSSAAPPPPAPVTLRSGNAQATPTGVSPYALVSGAVNKPMSCYNCGSQTHSGRDCQSPSMDDATRGAVYKLDYSVAAQQNAPNVTGTGVGSVGVATPINSPTGSQAELKQQDTHTTNAITPTAGNNVVVGLGGSSGGVSTVSGLNVKNM